MSESPVALRRGASARRQFPFGADKMAGVAGRIPFQIILMLGLGFPEFPGGNDLGDDFARPQSRCVDIGNRFFGNAPLIIVRVEDRRTITRSSIVALAITSARVVNLEEEFQKSPITDARGIESDLDSFRMAGVIAIGRIL